jgi:hypothetical protein
LSLSESLSESESFVFFGNATAAAEFAGLTPYAKVSPPIQTFQLINIDENILLHMRRKFNNSILIREQTNRVKDA